VEIPAFGNNFPGAGPGNSDFGHSQRAYRHELRDQRAYDREANKAYRDQQRAGNAYSGRDYDRGAYYDQQYQAPVYYAQPYTQIWQYIRPDLQDYRTSWQYAPYDPGYIQSYSDPYGSGYFGGGSSWVEQLVGSAVNILLGGLGGGYGDYGYQPQYGAVNNSYFDPYDYAYTDGEYYYSDPPAYYTDYYVPDAYVYSPIGNYYPVQQFGYYSGGLTTLFPYNYSSDPYYDNYTEDVVSQAYTYGYEQGYIAGQRDAQYRQSSYYGQPEDYGYNDYLYDGYSASLGENRYYLTRGYDLGYRDAYNGRNEYDPYSGGNVDLVSLLINGVLNMVNV
jgi:hypothetical protein